MASAVTVVAALGCREVAICGDRVSVSPRAPRSPADDIASTVVTRPTPSLRFHVAVIVGLLTLGGALDAPALGAAHPKTTRARVGHAGAQRHRLTLQEMARAKPIPPLRWARPGRRPARLHPRRRPVIAGPLPSRAWRIPAMAARLGSRAGARAASAEPYLEGYWPTGAYPAFVGRLYVKTLDGAIRYCSAATVAPSVVLTAAHCVMDGTRSHFNEWFAFVPRQDGSSLPYGVWWAKSALVSRYYGADGSATHDYAFLAMYPSRGPAGGLKLGDVVGWVPPLIYSPAREALHVGYPATGKFATLCSAASCVAWYCYSPIADAYVADTGAVVGLPCHTGFGSSGGPWLEPYAGGWYIASNVSSGSGGGAVFSEVWGPYFGADTLSLYQLALWVSAS
jgi:hypothetical protein